MSKLSQLKQEAYQAGKKRDWDLAVSIYEQILDIDKNNPMVINEMGDLCLKAGETPRSIRHFLNAASRYRTTGLLNNAVAIYKKILRYDADNQSAHWYLAETRASQGLLVEGQEHGIRFLENSERVSGDIKEIFLKRCGKLFELYSTSQPILEKLQLIFRTWDMNLEVARTGCLLACFSYEAGEHEEAKSAMQDILTKSPEVQNYPEFQRLRGLVDPQGSVGAHQAADVNALSLDDPAPVAPVSETPVEIPDAPADEVEASEPAPIQPGVTHIPEVAIPVEEPVAVVADDSFADSNAPVAESDSIIDVNPYGADKADERSAARPLSADETSFATVAQDIQGDDDDSITIEIPETASSEFFADEPAEPVEVGEDGCFDLSLDDDGPSFEDLVAQAATGLDLPGEPDDEVNPEEIAIAIDADDVSSVLSDEPAAPAAGVDLLAQILSEDDGSPARNENTQVAAITSDIGAQVGGAEGEQDPSSLYEMGMVYLDMGLFDQAIESFEKSAEDAGYTTRAIEMMGITLLKAQRPGDAIQALQRGREATEDGSRECLGMLYHLAQAHEQAEQQDDAIQLYQEIQAVDGSFLDVKDRLAQLAEV